MSLQALVSTETSKSFPVSRTNRRVQFHNNLVPVPRFKPKIKLGPNGGGMEMEANPIYEMLTPLRCVLVKRFAPENWRVVAAMEQGTVKWSTCSC